jgi:hypothetical protein
MGMYKNKGTATQTQAQQHAQGKVNESERTREHDNIDTAR